MREHASPPQSRQDFGATGRERSALTTSNFGGFDVALADADAGSLTLDTPLIKAVVPVAEIGLNDRVLDASGELPRRVRLFRLPRANGHRSLAITRRIPVRATGDTALYVHVTLELVTQA
jgi:hypothetical protein